jgi:hypothetical protein
MNMASKLFVSPLVCLLFMILSGAVSFWGMRMQQATIEEMHSVRFANYAKVGNIMNDTDTIHTNLYRLITLSRAGSDQKKLEAEIKGIQALLAKTAANFKGMAGDSKLKAEEQKFVQATDDTRHIQDANMLDMLESDVSPRGI